MTDKQIKVGDVVAWEDVPIGAMVRVVGDVDNVELPAAYAIRYNDAGGKWVYDPDEIGKAIWSTSQVTWRWHSAMDAGVLPPHGECTIIALDVPADATAEHLRESAEVFEIREVVTRMPACVHIMASSIDVEGPDFSWEWATRRLHRAGWRPGMTAEDAARLLSK